MAEAQTYVRLDKADFQFCAAHFCVFPDEREPLHGHNYRVYVELRGPTDELGYVAEFGWVKRHIRELVATLDHRVIVAEQTPGLAVKLADGQVNLQWRQDRWSFPEADVVCLPMRNSTAECLAGYLWEQVRNRIGTGQPWASLVVEVEETPGQRAGISRPIGV
jgi:6-pyruvoyltetrahydropterin/6-carboxytetrahydropterin synthase